MLDRETYWQAGIEAFRQALIQLAPEFHAAVDTLQDWTQCAVLNVQTGRVAQWYKPGLLLIGDAAHVMSPIGGVGINYAMSLITRR